MGRFRTAAQLDLIPTDDGVRVLNPNHHTGLEGPPELREILEFFRAPHTFEELNRSKQGLEIEEDTFQRLLRAFILIDEDDYPLYSEGSYLRTDRPIGRACSYEELFDSAVSGGFVVLGAPVDLACGTDKSGARHGPREIRRSFALPGFNSHPIYPEVPGVVLDFEGRRQLRTDALRIFDLGDVYYGPGESLQQFGRRLARGVTAISSLDMVPVVLGGDHSVAAFAIDAAAARHEALGIIHFDAHHDLSAFKPGSAALTHANPFLLAQRNPRIHRIHQVGLRTLEGIREGAKPLPHAKLSYVSARDALRASPAEVFQGLSRDLPYYLTFDVDCMDPMLAPETGSPVLGGLDFYTGLELIDYAARNFRLVGADFVEVCGSSQTVNQAARVSARYLAAVMLARVPHQPLEGYLFDFQEPS